MYNYNLNNYLDNESFNFQALQNTRLDLIGELEAIIQYDNHIKETNDEKLISTLTYIRDGELMHVGELLAAIFYLAPNQKQLVEQGYQRFVDRLPN